MVSDKMQNRNHFGTINYTHYTHLFAMQSHDLLSPLVQPLQCLKSSIFFIHEHQTDAVR